MTTFENPNDWIGKTVQWTSQSQGSSKNKKGEVIAILPAGREITSVIPASTKNSQLKGDRVGRKDRLVVRVPRGGKSVLVDFYTPNPANLKLVKEDTVQ